MNENEKGQAEGVFEIHGENRLEQEEDICLAGRIFPQIAIYLPELYFPK